MRDGSPRTRRCLAVDFLDDLRLAARLLDFDRVVVRLVAQEPAALVRPQARVQAVAREQAPVVALLDDAAVIDHEQAVHRGDRRQAVRDRHHRLAFHQPIEALLDRRLDFGVERAGRLVEQQDRRVLQHHARDRDALPLSARELHAALADVRVVRRAGPWDRSAPR